MGGRGGRGGSGANGRLGGNGTGLQGLINSYIGRNGGGGVTSQSNDPYTDNNNPNVLKYQAQEDDKTARYLAKVANTVDLNDPQYADGYGYHDLPLNKLLLDMGVTGGPTIMNDSDFNKYVAGTGQQVVYRGWSGQAAIDRFFNATHNHVGNGVAGDGYYFSPSTSVALRYSGNYDRNEITKMALSPNARVVSLTAVRSWISQRSSSLQSSLGKTGQTGSGRTYGSNIGESQAALKMGYNVIDMGGGYYVGITADAFVVSDKTLGGSKVSHK